MFVPFAKEKQNYLTSVAVLQWLLAEAIIVQIAKANQLSLKLVTVEQI